MYRPEWLKSILSLRAVVKFNRENGRKCLTLRSINQSKNPGPVGLSVDGSLLLKGNNMLPELIDGRKWLCGFPRGADSHCVFLLSQAMWQNLPYWVDSKLTISNDKTHYYFALVSNTKVEEINQILAFIKGFLAGNKFTGEVKWNDNCLT